MIRIIETNTSLTKDGVLTDAQSRNIIVPSWEEYIDLYKNYNRNSCGEYKSDLIGYVLPKDAHIESIYEKDGKLEVNLLLWNDVKSRKFAWNMGEYNG